MFKNLKWTSLLVVLLTVSLLFPAAAPATTIQGTDLQELRQVFDRHDAAGSGGNWYKNANNENATLAWHESRVLESYLRMFEATSDTYYLDKFIDHADGVLASRDSVRGVKDYRGLSLPAWRSLRYSLDKKPYIAAVHTGMISYPLAEFARIVKSHRLESYGAKAAEYLQAAKDAVAVHDDEWVESGDKGWYIFRKGAPIWCDGVNLPFNQFAAIARTQLAIYLTTGETKYLNRVQKMAKTIKDNLIYREANDSYVWNYTFGQSYTGWTAGDNVSVNTPEYKGYKSVEDISHGAIEAAFMYEAYQAGIVFTEQDMQRTGNTIEKNLIKPDGSIAKYVNGKGDAGSQTQKISLYLQYHKYAPSLMDVTQKINHNGSSATLELALYIKAAAEKQGVIGNPVSPDKGNETTPADNSPAGDTGNDTASDTPSPAPGEMVVNGDFSRDKLGWGPGGTIESAGDNKYITNGYNWNVFQELKLTPGEKYTVTADTKKGSASTPARISVGFYDSSGKLLDYVLVMYKHRGTGWESIPAKTITVPAGTEVTKLFLMINGGSGVHAFDNVSVRSANGAGPGDSGSPPANNTPSPAPGEMVVNGDFSRDKLGWGPGGTIESAGGNKYITNGYNWNVFQELKLTPGEKYTVTADTKKGSASTPARISVGFYDSSGKLLDYVLVMYKHRGTGWESIPAKTITVPAGTEVTKLFLMINGGSGVHAFDNVSVKRA